MTQALKTVHIVLVEDNPSDVYLIKMALQENHIPFALTHFETGEDALTALLREGGEGALLPDIILMDLNTPRSEGMEIFKALRQEPRLVGVPIGILTSSEAPADRQRAGLLGVTRYIRKPSGLYDFLRQVGQGVKELLREREHMQKAGGRRE
jgi:chemotaxis family two-component system response regulator Rcp1